MATRLILMLFLVSGFISCSQDSSTKTEESDLESDFEVLGHRGCRGLYPENSIPGFLHAVKLGVNTLELDLSISKDRQLIVSHEPWMSAKICLTPEGKIIKAITASREHNIYEMSLEEIRSYDCGSIGTSEFPLQERMVTYKPLLSELIDSVENYIRANKLSPVRYNMEMKSRPAGDNRFHPLVDEYSQIILDLLNEKGIADRCTFQCFDFRALEAMKKLAPNMPISALVDRDPDFNLRLSMLSFKPDYYSSNYELLTDSAVSALHAQGIKVIPWTVNTTAEMSHLIEMGVDGIITDYPDSLLSLIRQ